MASPRTALRSANAGLSWRTILIDGLLLAGFLATSSWLVVIPR